MQLTTVTMPLFSLMASFPIRSVELPVQEPPRPAVTPVYVLPLQGKEGRGAYESARSMFKNE